MSETLTHAHHLKAIRKMAGVRVPRRRRSRIPRQIYPRMIEHEYAEAIAELTSRFARRAYAELLAELPKILEDARLARADSGDQRRMFAGFAVVIENPAGSTRYWTDSDGTEGSTLMRHDYGYLDGFIGADGDEVDVYLGPDEEAEWVYVVHQRFKEPDAEDLWPNYDEDKVMLGWPSADEAKAAYLAQYDDPRFFGGMSVISLKDFRAALKKSEGGPITARLDADESKRAKKLIEKAKSRMSGLGSDRVEAIGRKFAEQTSSHQRRMINKQVRAALGVDVLFKDKGLAAKIQHFADENASLISSLQDKVHSEVSKVVMQAITEGHRHEDVAKKISDRFDIAENHARLIARDQIGKLYGQINASRQKELGVKKFIWRTVGDERVRSEHADREEESDPAKGGTPYSFDDPPDGELPGVPIQCRCTAEPVFDFDEE